MDDAGRGGRGLKPIVTPAVADVVAAAWGLDLGGALTLDGSTGLNLLVDDDGRRVVVRLHRRHVNEARVEALQLAREAAASGGVPTARTIPGAGGERCVTADGCVVEVEEFVESDAKMDTIDRIRQAMPLLAALHAALEDAALPDAANDLRFANYLAPAELSSRVATGIERVRSLGPALADLAGAAELLADRVASSTGSAGSAPQQWCHGDYWDNNVLFRDGSIVLVADFGFLNRRARVDDLALTLYFTLWDLDAAAHPDPLAQLARLVDAYNRGSSRPLSTDEIDELPVAIARQPLWSIGVWAAELDDDEAVRAHLEGHDAALRRGLNILDHRDEWRTRLTG